jgi:hypothetical protein
MRLSHGFVRGEALSCIYHGWSYDQSGQCLKIPAHPGLAPPDAIRVQTFVVCEQDAIIWMSTQDAATDPPSLKDLSPLRSLTILAGIDAIEAAAGAKVDADGLLIPSDASVSEPVELRLLLTDQGHGETLIHVLIPRNGGPSDRVAASRAAEALRRRAEGLILNGTAP